MGYICIKTGKKAAWVITEKNYTGLSNDLHNKKDLCKEIIIFPSKKLYKIAGFVMRLMKQIQRLYLYQVSGKGERGRKEREEGEEGRRAREGKGFQPLTM
jgi:ribosomal protein S17E